MRKKISLGKIKLFVKDNLSYNSDIFEKKDDAFTKKIRNYFFSKEKKLISLINYEIYKLKNSLTLNSEIYLLNSRKHKILFKINLIKNNFNKKKTLSKIRF